MSKQWDEAVSSTRMAMFRSFRFQLANKAADANRRFPPKPTTLPARVQQKAIDLHKILVKQ
jgi:hypothetical protein